MVTLELTDDEASLLREICDAHRHTLLHELHHTDDRAFRQLLREKSALLDRLTHRLAVPVPVERR